MPITALYAGLLALLFVFLAVRVIGARRSAKVAIGDGGDAPLRRRMRVHANFAEYVPLALLLIALLEGLKISTLVLHGLGVVLLFGRVVHAFGVSQEPEDLRLRVTGMVATFGVILVAGVICLAIGMKWVL